MFKLFTSDLRRNITKLLCLSIGMAIGLLLIAKIYFDQSYDTFLKDSDRIYQIRESIVQNGEYKEYGSIPGGVAPGMKRYVPQVEDATRITELISNCVADIDNQGYDIAGVTLADSCFFNVIERKTVMGRNSSEVLAIEDQCMIPMSLAEKIGGDVIGKKLVVKKLSPDYEMTIGGVYEDFPKNSSFDNQIYLSLKTIGKFMEDGTENWMGNDRYSGYVRLANGSTASDCISSMDVMINENVDEEAIKEFQFKFSIKPLIGLHLLRDGVKTEMWLLSILAILILLSGSINYLLIIVGQISTRSREMAVRKCFGTNNVKIFYRVLSESLVYLLLSIILSLIIIFAFKGLCQELLGYSPEIFLKTGRVWLVEIIVFIVLLFITGVIPAWIYCRTPVADAFRVNVKRRKGWKITMLSIEFIAAGFLLCFVVLIERQYKMLSNMDMGFEYENLGYVDLYGIKRSGRTAIISEIEKLGCVENVSTADVDFLYSIPGDNIWTEGRELDQVNVADMYDVNPNYFETLGMKFIQGGTFIETGDSTLNHIVVEEKMIDILNNIFGIEDPNIIGRSIHITGHESIEIPYTICGVIKNLNKGGYEKENVDTRVAVFFPSARPKAHLFIKFNNLTTENLQSVQKIFNNLSPDIEKYVRPYKEMVYHMSFNVRRMKKAVLIVGLSIFIIAILGLIGYTIDEVQMRSKEIAIRKITGTSDVLILKLFFYDILKVSIPALLIGALCGYITGDYWLSKFTHQVTMGPLIFLGCIVVIQLIILIVVALNSLGIARSNPVEYLRTE